MSEVRVLLENFAFDLLNAYDQEFHRSDMAIDFPSNAGPLITGFIDVYLEDLEPKA